MSAEARAAGGEDYGLLALVPPSEQPHFESVGFVTLGHASEGAGVSWTIDGRGLTSPSPAFGHFVDP